MKTLFADITTAGETYAAVTEFRVIKNFKPLLSTTMSLKPLDSPHPSPHASLL